MNKHYKMREKLSLLSRSDRQNMREYINDYEQLEQDVKRFMELYNSKFQQSMDTTELLELHNKLLKVGKSE